MEKNNQISTYIENAEARLDKHRETVSKELRSLARHVESLNIEHGMTDKNVIAGARQAIERLRLVENAMIEMIVAQAAITTLVEMDVSAMDTKID